MKPLTIIAGCNILAIVLYTVIIRLTTPRDSLATLMIAAVVVGLHVFACLMAAVVFSALNREHARAWLASAGIVLVVGFSACYGNAAL